MLGVGALVSQAGSALAALGLAYEVRRPHAYVYGDRMRIWRP